MAIDPKIKEKANHIRTAVLGRDVREALASGIEIVSETANEAMVESSESKTLASEAKNLSEQALTKAETALVKSENTQRQLDTIVIEGDSSVEAAQARVSLDGTTYGTLKQRLDTEYLQLSARLSQNQEDLIQIDAKKADRTELQTGLSTKITRDENESISWGMLKQEVKENISGDKVAVVGENSVNTSNLVDGSVTSVKRTAMGDVGHIIIGYGADNPVLDLINKRLIFNPTFWVVYKNERTEFTEQVVIPFDNITNQVLLFDTVGKTFRFMGSKFISQQTEHEIILMTLSFNSDFTVVKSSFSSFDFEIKGGSRQATSGEQAFIFNYDQPINFDFKNDKLIIPPGNSLYTNTKYIPLVPIESPQLEVDLPVDEFGTFLTTIFVDTTDRENPKIVFLPFDRINSTALSSNHYLLGYYQKSNEKAYLCGNYSINGNNTNNNIPDESIYKQDNKFSISGEIKNIMVPTLYDFFNSIPEPQEFHDHTIEIINRHSDIASFELLGQDAYGYPLYKYEIKPYEMRNSPDWNTTPTDDMGEPLKIPKIIITSGIHGSERNANFVVHHFIKFLLDNPDNIETFDTLAQNIHFIFIPLCNPSGYVDNTYENRAKVNLNRDFPPYGSATQPETQLIKAIFDEHADADYHIDYHNFTPQSGKYHILGYALTDNPELKRLTTNAYKYVGRQWQLKDERFPQSRYHQWAYTADANDGTAGKYTNTQLGIPSSIVETPKWQMFFEEQHHGKSVTQLGVDVLTNVIINIVKFRM